MVFAVGIAGILSLALIAGAGSLVDVVWICIPAQRRLSSCISGGPHHISVSKGRKVSAGFSWPELSLSQEV